MSSLIDLTQARIYLTDLVSQAGGTLKKHFISGDFTSRSKGGVDVVTQADEEVDKFLRENIQKQYPQTKFLTEETAPQDYSSFKELNNLWIIDPLDGTVNFSRGNSNFSISVGLVDKGVSKLGVVYVPMTDELYAAQADKNGAFLNGKLIQVASTSELNETVLACNYSWILEQRLTLIKSLSNLAPHIRQIRTLCSAVADSASLANGKIDVYFNPGLFPWDCAASALLIEKAGGKITTSTGEKWDVFNPDMLATNKVLHEKILDLLSK